MEFPGAHTLWLSIAAFLALSCPDGAYSYRRSRRTSHPFLAARAFVAGLVQLVLSMIVMSCFSLYFLHSHRERWALIGALAVERVIRMGAEQFGLARARQPRSQRPFGRPGG